MIGKSFIITASCHCKINRYSFTVNESDLPFKPHLCSCNISRRISGVLLTSYFPISAQNSFPKRDGLTAYKSSGILTRYFCSSCGSHMFLEYAMDGHWEVSTGTISESVNIVQFQGHMWIEDTQDGGASDWITEIGSIEASRWLKESNRGSNLPLDWRVEETVMPNSKSDIHKLHAHCHCNGVEFYVTRPNKTSQRACSPFPDLLVPFTTQTPPENTQNSAWWLATDHKRYLAGNCACQSCRQVAGFDLVQWAFIPRSNIVTEDGRLFSRSSGTMKTYSSSSGVTRSFCGRCGANIFWEGDFRPDIVDVAVGIMDAESGARAEEWLEWATDRISFQEEAHNPQLIAGLGKGLQSWKSRRESPGTTRLGS